MLLSRTFYKKKTGSYIIGALCLALIFLFFLSLCMGAVPISLGEIFKTFLSTEHSEFSIKNPNQFIFFEIRLPRVLLSMFVGSILACCGVALQGLFRNSLADPSIIGVSSGASLFAVLSIVLINPSLPEQANKLNEFIPLLSLFSFLGAVFTTSLVFFISEFRKNKSVLVLLLAGMAINAISGGLTGLITYMADDVQLRSFTFWTLGSLSGASWKSVAISLSCLLIILAVLLPLAKALNALYLGKNEAQNLGVEIPKVKRLIIFSVALGIGSTVALCGFIGFIGLIVPHMLRIIGGADHRFILPSCVLGGAVLLMLSDSLSRQIALPAEVPVGIITSLIGGPIFLFMLLREKRNYE